MTPRDPRSRAVVKAATLTSGRRGGCWTYELTLECGHTAKRRVRCLPARIVCHDCPIGEQSGLRS